MNSLLQLHKLNEQHRTHIEKQARQKETSPVKTIIVEGDFSVLIADEERRRLAKLDAEQKKQSDAPQS